jgi:hypothetical protein
MSKSKASRTRARDAKHVRLYLYMLKTDAWLSLSCRARCLLIELQALYNGTNNGQLFMSVRDAAKALRCNKDQAMAAFAELEDRGFIRATRRGTPTRRDENRLATCWRLTEFDDDVSGRQPTKEYMTWKAAAKPTVSKRAEQARAAAMKRWQKNSTVPSTDTHRTVYWYGQEAPDPKNMRNRTVYGYAQADSEGSTVPSTDTQLVNQGMVPEKSEPGLQAALPWVPATTLRGPLASSQFGGWIIATANQLGCPREHIANALRVDVADIERMTRAIIAGAAPTHGRRHSAAKWRPR